MGRNIWHGRSVGSQVLLGLTAVFAMAFGATSASADPIALSPVTASAGVSIEGGDNNADLEAPPSSLPLTLNVADDEGNSAYAAISGGLDPSITVTAAGTQGGAEELVAASGSLNYSFVIIGPATGYSIPVLFTGSVSAALSESDGAGASWGTSEIDVTAADGTEIQSETGGAFNDALSLVLGSVYDVAMEADAHAWGAEFTHIATSSIDPSFTIDPTFQNADQYTIDYSPGLLSTVAAVPEPSTLALFGSALLGLCIFGAKRRPKVVALSL